MKEIILDTLKGLLVLVSILAVAVVFVVIPVNVGHLIAGDFGANIGLFTPVVLLISYAIGITVR